MKKIFSALLAVIFGTVYSYSVESPGISCLKTPHFKIIHNDNITPYAFAIADRAETHYKNIESFLSYSLDEEILISTSGSSSLSAMRELNSIKLSNPWNFYDADCVLYRKIFNRFIDSIFSKTSGMIKRKPVSDIFIDMLCSYSIQGFNINNELILRDQFLTSGDFNIKISESGSSEGEITEALYAGFFYFLEYSYGRKTMLRALKDASFYGSFLTALNSVTGKSFDELNREFNNFFSVKFSGSASGNDIVKFSNVALNGFINDFYIDNNILAVLTSGDGTGSIITIDLKTERPASMTVLPGNLNYISIIPVYSNKLAVAGNSNDGSTVLIYNTELISLTKALNFPGVYVNRFHNSERKGVLLFNSEFGVSKGIIEVDYSSGVLNKKNASDINRVSDIILHGGSVYYISKRELNELIEYDLITGEKRTLLSLKDEIASLSLAGNGIVLTCNNSSGGYVSLLNPENLSLKPLITGTPLLYKAVLSEHIIYMLAYYNGSRKIIKTELVD